MTLSKLIKIHRKSANLTQKELADLSGLGKTVIFDIENGKETIKYATLMKILGVLNVKLKAESRLFKKEEILNATGKSI